MSISTASNATLSRCVVIVAALAAIESEDVSTVSQPFGVVFSMSISYGMK